MSSKGLLPGCMWLWKSSDCHAKGASRIGSCQSFHSFGRHFGYEKGSQNKFQKLDEVFQKFRDAQLRIHSNKCNWAVKRVYLIGYISDKRGISLD